MKSLMRKDDLDELDALRIENDLLRRKLKEFEEGLAKIELDTARRNEDPELDRLQKLVNEINGARNEALAYGEKHQQLEGDVSHLYGLLMKAKAERGAFVELVRRVEAVGQAKQQRIEELEEELECERAAFSRMLRQDRATAERRLAAVEKGLVRRGEMMKTLLQQIQQNMHANIEMDQDMEQKSIDTMHQVQELEQKVLDLLQDPTALSDNKSMMGKKKSKKAKKKQQKKANEASVVSAPNDSASPVPDDISNQNQNNDEDDYFEDDQISFDFKSEDKNIAQTNDDGNGNSLNIEIGP